MALTLTYSLLVTDLEQEGAIPRQNHLLARGPAFYTQCMPQSSSTLSNRLLPIDG